MGSKHWKCILRRQDQRNLFIIAGPEFGELQGHLLVIVWAIYGTRSAGTRWHYQLFGYAFRDGFLHLPKQILMFGCDHLQMAIAMSTLLSKLTILPLQPKIYTFQSRSYVWM